MTQQAVTVCRALPLLAMFSIVVFPSPVVAEPQAIDIEASLFTDFKPSEPERRDFGRLTFRQGAVLSSPSDDFGGISGLHMMDGGSQMLAISDTGFWLKADVIRNEDGLFSGLSNAIIAPIRSGVGPVSGPKYYTDAEGFDVRGAQAFVSFENVNIVSEYPLDLAGLDMSPTVLDLPSDISDLGVNKGLEALAIAPDASALAGHFVAIVEEGVAVSGDASSWIVSLDDGSKKQGPLTIRRHDRFDVTDAAFLENGDLLLVERRFTLATGVGMRLRLIDGDDLVAGTVVDGERLYDAGLSYRIDNMEGIATFENDAGETIISIIADDNKSIIQRTIYLEFVLQP